MGVASLSPALPEIQQYFGITKIQTGYLIMAFTLPGVVLTPVLGILADRYGRKTILIPSLLLFGLAGGLCAFSENYLTLLALRLLQGVGAAALGSLNVTIIGDLFEGRKRGAAMGYNASILSIGTAVYPAIGGALAQLGWNFPFLLAFAGIPVGLWVMYALHIHTPRNEQTMADYLSHAAKTVFKLEPMVLFSISILSFVILYGAVITYFPFFMKEKFQATPVLIGSIMSVMSFSSALASSRSAALQRRFNSKRILMFAFAFYAASCLIIPFSGSVAVLIAAVLLFGAAQGANLPNLLTLIANLAPDQHRAVFMSTNGMALRMGQTLGPFIMGAVYGLGGIQWVFFSGSIIAVFLFFLVQRHISE